MRRRSFFSTLSARLGLSVALLSLLPTVAQASTFYLSPTGQNLPSGGSSSAPWKTFAFAIPRLQPGDTLILKDGVYEGSSTGYPNINCKTTSGAKSGTSSARITIAAQNERQAFIRGDSSAGPFVMRGCSYWDITGLRIEHTDFGTTANHALLEIRESDNIRVRHNLVAKSNRCKNTHGIALLRSSQCLVEENEIYQTHRHHIFLNYTKDCVIRRNYGRRRIYPELTSASCSGVTPFPGGTEGISLYPAHNNVVENNIMEGDPGLAFSQGFVINAASTADNNRLYGNIALNSGTNGIKVDARGQSASTTPHSNWFVDQVVIGAQRSSAISLLGTNDTRCERCSILKSNFDGITATACNVTLCGAGPKSFLGTNILLAGHSGSAARLLGLDDLALDYANSFDNGGAFVPSASDPRITNERFSDPKLGACLAWIPASSPMKGAGKNGADIGANVLYQYQNGALTRNRLWNPSLDGGRFTGCGAQISGVNDLPGQSCFDVHKRLNVNHNGCAFPAGYTSAPPGTAGPKAPSGLTVR